MPIVAVDPNEMDAVAAFHRIYVTVGEADNPDTFVAAPLEEIHDLLAIASARFACRGLLALEDGAPVASGLCALDLKDEPERALLTPRVLPGHRRRGHGTRVLEHLERRAVAHGRSLLQATAVWSSAHPNGATAAPARFAAARGWALALTNVRLRLALPSDAEQITTVVAERAGRREGYTTVDPDAIRDDERHLARSGRVKINAAALSPTGEVVALSSILTRPDGPGPAHQQGTVVDEAHRGRGLGAVVKAAALEQLERTRPDIRAVITETAQDNGPMLALNRALGWVPVLSSGDFQAPTR
ncbi:GNAT family N-acetyltransferase [Conexibacter sp. DBS9H8]|uniref:GNAT family N-acetyltransferase n=1 Tax=Conexibacter sp. DBS9H8 TaxID=2937801 RepID=UPI00200ED703|nr:GNAT family N-acetyltransferase [Conexibacter sp. DBS9H8]